MNPENVRPEWLRTACKIWEADDARPPDAETLEEAWKRFFGQPGPAGSGALSAIDDGDTIYRRYEKGIEVRSVTGAEIMVEPSSPWYDWTIDPTTVRTNSSQEYLRVVQAIFEGIRQGAAGNVLHPGWTLSTAHYIAAQLAHVHRLRPVRPPERVFPKESESND